MKTPRAHGFNQRPRFEQVVGYLERNEPLPLDQPDRKATSFVTSHFYQDDFVQSSKDPNPWPLQHTPLQAISEEGFRTPAEATDEDVRLARRYQGYGGATGRGRPPSRTACAALQTARRLQRQRGVKTLPLDYRRQLLPRLAVVQRAPRIPLCPLKHRKHTVRCLFIAGS